MNDGISTYWPTPLSPAQAFILFCDHEGFAVRKKTLQFGQGFKPAGTLMGLRGADSKLKMLRNTAFIIAAAAKKRV